MYDLCLSCINELESLFKVLMGNGFFYVCCITLPIIPTEGILNAQYPTIRLKECLKEKLRSAIMSLNPSRNNLFYPVIENKHK